MKKKGLFFLFLLFLALNMPAEVAGQCSICTKTTQQLGEEPAKGFNSGIIYLALFPFLVLGYIGYRWWTTNREE